MPTLGTSSCNLKERLWIRSEEAVWLDSDITVWSKPTANQRLCAIKQLDGGLRSYILRFDIAWFPWRHNQWKWRNRVVSCFDPVPTRDGAVVWAQAGSAFHPYWPAMTWAGQICSVVLDWAELRELLRFDRDYDIRPWWATVGGIWSSANNRTCPDKLDAGWTWSGMYREWGSFQVIERTTNITNLWK